MQVFAAAANSSELVGEYYVLGRRFGVGGFTVAQKLPGFGIP